MAIMLAAKNFLQSRVVRTILKVTLVVALIAAAIYWFRFSPVQVSTVDVIAGDIAAEVMGTGTLEARTKAILSPKISGRLIEVSADQGDRVEAGGPVMRLDDSELKQQVEMAKVSIAAEKAALNRFEADKAQTAAILTLAEKDHARIVTLSKSNAATVSDLEKSAEQLDVARAGISRSEAAMAEALQQVLVAESTLAYHEARLADTVVAAPFRGLIVQRFRDPGAIAVPGSPVLSLISTDELWITAWVDETEMSRIAVGQPARVVFRSEPEAGFRGEVARLGREADRETREFTVDVKVLELPKNWAVGQRAEVYIQTVSKTNTALLPVTAVVWRDGASGVLPDGGTGSLPRRSSRSIIRQGRARAFSVSGLRSLASGATSLTRIVDDSGGTGGAVLKTIPLRRRSRRIDRIRREAVGRRVPPRDRRPIASTGEGKRPQQSAIVVQRESHNQLAHFLTGSYSLRTVSSE